MMNEDDLIERMIREHGEPCFRDQAFDLCRAAPRTGRMFLAMRILEGQINNGGLAQFLWNFFFHWRPIVEDCTFAYAAIGAERQAAAMPECFGSFPSMSRLAATL